MTLETKLEEHWMFGNMIKKGNNKQYLGFFFEFYKIVGKTLIPYSGDKMFHRAVKEAWESKQAPLSARLSLKIMEPLFYCAKYIGIPYLTYDAVSKLFQ